MAPDTKTRISRYYRRLWNDADVSAIDEACHEDLTDHWHQQTGRDAWRSTAQDLLRTFPDLHFEITLQVMEDDIVATHWIMHGTDDGGLFRLSPTGRAAEFTGVFIDRLDGGRIVEHWAVSDMWRLLRQLEVVPPSWQGDAPLAVADPPDEGLGPARD